MANTKNKNNKNAKGGASRSASARSTNAKVSVSTKKARGERSYDRAPSRSDRRESPNPAVRREVGGIALIIVGIILGIFCYFGSSGILAAVAPVLFGLFGIAVYVLPPILIALGVLMIILPKSDLRPAAIACIAVIFFAVIALIHVISHGRSLVGARFGEALSGAYRLGTAHSGGGFFGGFFAYLLVLLLGVTGAIVALSGIILICALLVTHFSISAYFSNLREARRTDAPPRRREKRKLYNEELADEEGFIEHSGKPLTAGDTGYAPSARRRPEAQKKPAVREVSPSKRDLLPLGRGKKQDGDIEFLPMSGPLKSGKPQKKRRRDAELIESFDSPVAGGAKLVDDDYSAYIPMNSNPFGGVTAEPAEPIPEVPVADEGAKDILAGVNIEIYDDGKDAASEKPNKKPLGEPVSEDKKQKTTEADPVEAIAEPPVYEYRFPPIELLSPPVSSSVAAEPPEEKARILIETLQTFGISARVVNISVGPVITRFEIQPAPGIRINKITQLNDDIAYALAAESVRIEAPIPGKSAVGIEIPNRKTASVLLREIIDTPEFRAAKSPLTFALGKDIAGKVVLGDLSKMPHMLVAGRTGAGKSVCINGIILSFIYKASPKEVRMILIDPKQVEFSVFDNIPHRFAPVITDVKKAAGALRWAVAEMDMRYQRMAKLRSRDLDHYNSMQTDENERWPRLVIVIDELADLMIVAGKDVEESICRIAQLGRACGIHLIVATQRPSVDVITGLIKANIPSRIAFAVSNGTDSRVILDTGGAERLLGRGDMLFHANGAAKPIRAQGAFVDVSEAQAVNNFFVESAPNAPEMIGQDVFVEVGAASAAAPGQGNGKQEDDLLPDAVRLVIESGAASISMIQRRLRVGYARAARLVDIMEQKGYVSRADGAKPRNVLISAAQFTEIFGGEAISASPVVSGDYYEGEDEDDA